MFKKILIVFLIISFALPSFSFAENNSLVESYAQRMNQFKTNGLQFETEGDTPDFALDRVLVKMKPQGFSMFSVESEYGGLEIEEVISLSKQEFRLFSSSDSDSEVRLLKLRYPGRNNIIDAVEILSSLPNVLIAEPDYLVHTDEVPNDPLISSLSGMTKISAQAAWDKHIDCSDVVVGIIDTGIDYTHPDLASNIWRNPGEIPNNSVDDDGNGYIDDVYGWNFVSDSNDIMDDNSHGTHVAGTIGAVGNNGIGVAGVAWNAKLMGLKVLNENGSGLTSDIIQAINYAAVMGVPITNNSYGGTGYSQIFRDAISAANLLCVASAGNESANNDMVPSYPAAFDCPNIITVASTANNDTLSTFSNYGAKTVDIAAPGNNITSTVPGGQYAAKSGTSMATPHVTGAAALVAGQLISQGTTLTTQDILRRVMYNNDSVGLAGKVFTGGRLNAVKALTPAAFQPVQSISVSSSYLSINRHGGSNVTATISPSSATDKRVLWKSADPSVAQVVDGKIIGISVGYTKVIVSSVSNPEISREINVTVSGNQSGVTIPDSGFKQELIYALRDYATSMPWARSLGYDKYNLSSDITQEDLTHINSLDLRYKSISSLSGIEFCINLQALICKGNQLTSLDVSALPNLFYLNCSENILSNLSFNENNPWEGLYIQNNVLNVADGTALKNKINTVISKTSRVTYSPQSVNTLATSISLSASSASLKALGTKLLIPTFYPSESTNKNVVWSSSNENVAIVFDNGVVIGIRSGTATIRATAADGSNKSASCTVTVSSTLASPVAFADSNFKAMILNALGYDPSDNLYPADLSVFTGFAVDDAAITNIPEISYFLSLERFYLLNAKVKNLNLSSNLRLRQLSSWDCGLESLNLSNLSDLKFVYVSNTKLNSLTLTGANNIRIMALPDNNLTNLSMSNLTKLEVLQCTNNRLTSLTIPSRSSIEQLMCENNMLTGLDVSGCTKLGYLKCQNNQLTSLNINTIVNNDWGLFYCQNNLLDISSGSAFRTACETIAAKCPASTVFGPQKNTQKAALTVSPNYLRMMDVSSASLTATVSSSISDKTLEWSSDNTGVVKVNQSGYVTKVARGSATIRVKLKKQPDIFVDIPVSVTTASTDGNGTAANPYKVRTMQDVLIMGYSTTSGDFTNNTQNLAAYYSLEPNNGQYIDMMNVPMIPIGYRVGNTSTGGFSGTFDGKGKKIVNLKIQNTIATEYSLSDGNQNGIGMFAYINGGTVKDLQLDNAKVEVTADNGYYVGAGILSGTADLNAVVTDNKSSGSISASGDVSNVGGLIGFIDRDSNVSRCSSSAAVNGGRCTGGLIGLNKKGQISDCSTTGSVTGTIAVGGLVGGMQSNESEDGIGSLVNSYSTCSVKGKQYVGGLLGATYYANVNNCYATGNVTGEEFVGGFIGSIDIGAVRNNYSGGAVSGIDYVGGFAGTVEGDNQALICENNYSASKIAGKAFVGGFAGYIDRTTVKNCLAGGDVNGTSDVGGFAGLLSNGTIVNNCRYFAGQMVERTNNNINNVSAVFPADIASRSVLPGDFVQNGTSGLYYPCVKKYNSTELVPNQQNILIEKSKIGLRICKENPLGDVINISFYNNTGTTVNGVKYVAELDKDNKVVHIETKSVILFNKANNGYTYTPKNIKTDYIHVFIWNNGTHMNPLCKSLHFDIE